MPLYIGSLGLRTDFGLAAIDLALVAVLKMDNFLFRDAEGTKVQGKLQDASRQPKCVRAKAKAKQGPKELKARRTVLFRP